MNAPSAPSVRKYTRLHAHAVQDPTHLDEALTRQVVGQSWSSLLGRKADVHKLTNAGLLQLTPISPDQWVHGPEAMALAHLDPRPVAVRVAILHQAKTSSITGSDLDAVLSGKGAKGDQHPASGWLPQKLSQMISDKFASWQPQHTLWALVVLALLLLAFVMLH